MKTRTRTADVSITQSDSIWLFRPNTEAAGDWFDKHVQSSPWQWVGGSLLVETRLIQSLLVRLGAEAFTFEVD